MKSQVTISIQEWRWVIYGSVAILILSCVPFLIVWQSTPPGWQFTGILVNPLDGHSYLAKMTQGSAGDWLFHLTYTPEAHPGAFIFTFYLALGHVARLVGAPNVIIFHLARLLAGLLLLLTVFRFVAHVTPYPGERRLALLYWSGFGLGLAGNSLWRFSHRFMGSRSLCSLQSVCQSSFPVRNGPHVADLDRRDRAYIA